MSGYVQGDLMELLPPAHVISSRQVPHHGETDWWEDGKRHVRKWVRVWWVWDCSCGQSTGAGDVVRWGGECAGAGRGSR